MSSICHCCYVLSTFIILIQLFHIEPGSSHQHSYQHHYNTHKHSHKLGPDPSDRAHKRQTDPLALESTTYKKVVKIQEDGKEPIEKSYTWSSANNPGNVLPSSGDKSDLANDILKRLNIPSSQSSGGDTSERISYNISITQSSRRPLNLGSKQKLVCPENQYGNEVIGCRKCQCNDNIDLTDTGNCDPATGKCLKCLYDTAGDHCEICRTNYTGDATKRLCRECVCNRLGTDPLGEPCHQTTGQCSCLPHVEGLDCSTCKPGYFNFSSGTGCQPCGCDSLGSVSSSCNVLDGKCECRAGYGGLKCNECPLGTFGDPKIKCRDCDCNREGSLNQDCDTKTGKCQCRTGSGGDKCDRCARGYHGTFPNCEYCGECFKQWDEIIGQLKNQTQNLLDRVKKLLEIGTVGNYGKEFRDIEDKLDRIKHILDNQKLDKDAMDELSRKLKALSKLLRDLEKTLSDYEKDAERTTNRTLAVQNGLRDYDALADRLHIMIEGLRENATQFQAGNVDGAYAIILDSQNRSREAEKSIRDMKPLVLKQEERRRIIENKLISTARYNISSLQNEAILASLMRQIQELENNVPGINQLVCASQSTVDKCDQLCGGSLCNKCGGSSCAGGATTMASNALNLANQAIDLLNQKFNQSKLDLEALNEVKKLAEEALRQAKLAMENCELGKSKFDKIANELNGIMDSIDKFALMDGAKPAEVRTLGTECLGLSVSLKPEQILDLAKKINETLSSLTDIDKILQETAGDLNTAEQLHLQADKAKEAADNILDAVEQVLNMLRLAAIEQAKAAAAIAAAEGDIDGAQTDLAEIMMEIELLAKIIQDLADRINKLRDRLNELRKKYAQNELYVTQARAAADEAGKLTDQAEKGADELAEKVAQAQEKLRNKARLNGELKDRAERLKEDAHQLAAEIKLRMDLLRELDDLFDEDVKRMKDFQDIVDDLHRQMNQYLRDIDERAQYYRDCQT